MMKYTARLFAVAAVAALGACTVPPPPALQAPAIECAVRLWDGTIVFRAC